MNSSEADETRRYGAIIVAAGRGERAGSPAEGPKQYRLIGGRPVVVHTLEVFLKHPLVERVVLVTHPDDDASVAKALSSLGSPAAVTTVHGGPARQESVLNGLRALAATGATHVLIHDAVRPFVRPELIDRIDAAFRAGARAVLPATAVCDTLKHSDPTGHVDRTVPRTGLHAAQTPQAFVFSEILSAHEAAAASGRQDFTDDAAIAEAAGIPVRLIEGDPENMKLTLASDIEMADEKLQGRAIPDVRTGNGYDVHRLVPGDGVTLCGIFIAHDQTLDGHSDADVGLHALTDALLATCGAGDIGDHFPPSDPKWKGAPSSIFVRHAVEIVRAAGGTITNADVSIIAEAPRIGPHRDEMRTALAAMLGISRDRCSVKATTNEAIGFVGRREGIAAIATATVVYARPPR